VKILNLGLLESEEVLEALREEIFTMCQLDHPNILRLEEVYESETQIFLIQVRCSLLLFERNQEQFLYFGSTHKNSSLLTVH
jgi:calcium-dependent protein kinase